MTDERIAALEAQIAALKATQPTPIDPTAVSAWRDKMHEIAERRALRDAKSFFSPADLAAMRSAAPDDQVKAIALRDARAPTGPSSAGIVPTSQPISNVRVGGGTGWGYVAPIRNGIGGGK